MSQDNDESTTIVSLSSFLCPVTPELSRLRSPRYPTQISDGSSLILRVLIHRITHRQIARNRILSSEIARHKQIVKMKAANFLFIPFGRMKCSDLSTIPNVASRLVIFSSL
jgi:hypothetical protein